jgi:hypothetical protein
MCDWGRSEVVVHRVKADGPTFTQQAEEFMKVSQVSDIDVDGSGRMYLAAWDGAGYQGDPRKGYVVRVVPEGWRYREFPDLSAAPESALVDQLMSPSATARLAAQQAILARPAPALESAVARVALDRSQPAEVRVAAVFTYKQMRGAEAREGLLKLAEDPVVREHALRALADRIEENAGLDPAPLVAALADRDPGCRWLRRSRSGGWETDRRRPRCWMLLRALG